MHQLEAAVQAETRVVLVLSSHCQVKLVEWEAVGLTFSRQLFSYLFKQQENLNLVREPCWIVTRPCSL